MARPTNASLELAKDPEHIAELVKDKETRGLVEYLLKRIEAYEESLTQFNSKMDAVVARVDTVEAVMKGEDAGFEKSLKGAVAGSEPKILSKSESEIRGTLASTEIQDMVHRVLGSDCHAYIKSDNVLPQSFLSLLVPERLSGVKDDYRSRQINNASAGSDVKKWCETVKSNLFRQYVREDKGTPDFRIR